MTRMKYAKQTAPKLLPADPFHQKLTIELSFTIMRGWALSDSEQFTLTGLKDTYIFQLWQQRVFTELSKETYLRLACVIDVNRQLKLMGTAATSAVRWLKSNNPAFQDQSPLHHMLSQGLEGIQDVSRVLCQQAHYPLNTTQLH